MDFGQCPCAFLHGDPVAWPTESFLSPSHPTWCQPASRSTSRRCSRGLLGVISILLFEFAGSVSLLRSLVGTYGLVAAGDSSSLSYLCTSRCFSQTLAYISDEDTISQPNIGQWPQIGQCCQYFLFGSKHFFFSTNIWSSLNISLPGRLYINPSVQNWPRAGSALARLMS